MDTKFFGSFTLLRFLQRPKVNSSNSVTFVVLKSIRYAEIKPELISGNKEYDKNFFKQLDAIENNVLDGQSFEETAKENNLKIIEFDKINAKKENQAKNKLENLPDNLFRKIC